ncbi:MAG: nuclear transport factor 2 family protein [Salinibacter sp.]
MTDDEKHALIRRYLDAYNAFDVDGMVEPLHPDVEIKNVSDGEVSAAATGVEEFRTMAEKAAELFASRRQTVTAVETEEGGGVSIDVTYEGTLAQDLPGGVEAGETVQLEGRSTFGFDDGKIARIVDYS